MHALANDPSIPAVLARAFSRVSCQIVRIYDDGSEGIINMVSRDKADAELVEHRKRIGHGYERPEGGIKILTDVVIRTV